MTEETKTTRPTAPWSAVPSIEEELQKIVDTGVRRNLNAAGVASSAQKPVPNNRAIVDRLNRTLERVRDIDASATAIAGVLAGPNAGHGHSLPGAEATSGATVFELYAWALDEIDLILDNVEREQARTRDILI